MEHLPSKIDRLATDAVSEHLDGVIKPLDASQLEPIDPSVWERLCEDRLDPAMLERLADDGLDPAFLDRIADDRAKQLGD